MSSELVSPCPLQHVSTHSYALCPLKNFVSMPKQRSQKSRGCIQIRADRISFLLVLYMRPWSLGRSLARCMIAKLGRQNRILHTYPHCCPLAFGLWLQIFHFVWARILSSCRSFCSALSFLLFGSVVLMIFLLSTTLFRLAVTNPLEFRYLLVYRVGGFGRCCFRPLGRFIFTDLPVRLWWCAFDDALLMVRFW